jgi:alcohol dehydrogenase class IV
VAIAQKRFTWQDGERTIHFGRGALADAPGSLGEGFTLLTTARARAMAPELSARAGAVHEVPTGRVDELAGALLGEVDPGVLIVALGGGRVIDVAKALSAARPVGARPRVAAVPTTLSAAEMTTGHRRAAGADGSLPGVRPAIVINDPALSASQPDAALAASAANALGHAAEGPATLRTSPVPALAGREAARLIGLAYYDGDEPDRDTLALAALLSGYAIDSSGYGLHHVLSQTLVRFAGVGHGQANAAMLPHTLRALEHRGAPGAGQLVPLATALAGRAQAARLRDLGVDEAVLDACADTAASRPELDLIPPRPDRDELRELYASAF